MAKRLSGKSAVVTGAASGMGKAIAIAYLKEGSNVVAADINEDGLVELGKEVDKLGFGTQFKSIRCDVRNDEDCANAVKTCVDAFGSCNVLSSNAGVLDDYTMVGELKNEEWNRIIDINLTGQMKICRAALQYFLPNQVKASIVMITSNSIVESSTGGPAYTAAKCGANSLVKTIAFEYSRQGIRINSICPGQVATNIIQSVPGGAFNEAGIAVHTQTGYNAHCAEWAIKNCGSADEIAAVSVFLASDESSYVNAASIIVDGGICLG